MTNKVRNWIVYQTDRSSAPGWEERRLMPRSSLTNILWEYQTSSHKVPQVGDRVERFENLCDPGNGAKHAGVDDWVVTEIDEFSSNTSEGKIFVCYCEYSPVERHWEEMKRGKPVTEMLTSGEV